MQVAAYVAQFVILPAIGYGSLVLRGIRVRLDDIRDELQTLNGRVTRAEQWRDDHEKTDEYRERMYGQGIERMEDEIRALRERLFPPWRGPGGPS